jgi:acyl-CoA synthetase (AMP-forming)/AMP-acid ligase II
VSELAATFLEWARLTPTSDAYTFLGPDGRESYTRRQILDRAQAKIPDLLRWQRASDGPHRVLLTPPASMEFVAWFWAAQLLGIPVVPAPEATGRFRARFEQIRSVSLATPVEEIRAAAGPSSPADLEAPVAPIEDDTPAVVQFTSGSVSDPKGCLLSHRAVVGNMRAATTAFRVGAGKVGVSWCPLYHDMGLFGSVVYPVFCGVHAVLQQPDKVVLRPVSWLDEVARSGAAITLAPSFALDLVVRHLRKRAYDKDLSSLEQIIVGSERVHPRTVDAFLRLTTPAGLDPSSIHVAWGMAEGTVLCTSRPGGLKEDRSCWVFPDGVASVGWPAPGVEVRVRPEGTAVADGVVGDVEIRSSGLMSGYWRASGDIEDPRSSDGWFSTGDSGFISDGELYILGRADDVLISEGRNFYPQDAEALLSDELDFTRPGGVAVVGIAQPSQRDAVVALIEARRPLDDDDRGAARRVCLDRLGLRLDDVRSVPVRSLPRTSSGKLMRSRIRTMHSSAGGTSPDGAQHQGSGGQA